MNGGTIREGACVIKTSQSVFFNPAMEFCRDFSSMGVGALGESLDICDAMCGTGIRGIRYKLENENVGELTLVDANPYACDIAKENLRLNRVEGHVIRSEINRFIFSNENIRFNFVELDPFGSPAPYLNSIFYSFARNNAKKAYVSITATDMAVLCGTHVKACVKNYWSKPMRTEYCHEIAARILLHRICLVASEFSYGIEPLFSLSRQHYLKIFLKIIHGADNAYRCMQQIGYILHCKKCLRRVSEYGLPDSRMCGCGEKMDYAGPLWLGNLHDAEFLNECGRINYSRRYKNNAQIARVLSLMLEENDMPASYYDIHKLCERTKSKPPKIGDLIGRLHEAGFTASRTHFKSNGVKTNADVKQIRELL